MNYTFEGNYKSKRNINLGGVKSHADKKSLMAKAQEERRARERDRLRLQSAQNIQAFYRGRRVARQCRQGFQQQLDVLLPQLKVALDVTYPSTRDAAHAIAPLIIQCLRHLLLLSHATESASQSIGALCSLLDAHPAWLAWLFIDGKRDDTMWQVALLAERLLLPIATHDALKLVNHVVQPTSYPDRHTYLAIVAHLITKGNLFACLGLYARLYPHNHAAPLQIATSLITHLHPPLENIDPMPKAAPHGFDPTPVPVFFTWQPANNPNSAAKPANPELTRSYLLQRCAMDLLTVPSIIDTAPDEWIRQWPLDDLLQAILAYFDNPHANAIALADDDIACLWINITLLSQHSNERLQNAMVSFVKALQVLLYKLPAHYLVDAKRKTYDLDNSDSDSDDENAMRTRVATTASLPQPNPWVKTQLARLYDKDNFRALVLRLVDLCRDALLIQSVTSLFVAFLVRWPAQKDTLLTTLLYHHQTNTTNITFIDLLWHTWRASPATAVFGKENIIAHLDEARDMLLNAPEQHVWAMLYLFCELESRLLLTVGDDEFYDPVARHLSIHDMVLLSTHLKNVAFVLFWRSNIFEESLSVGSIQVGPLRHAVTMLVRQIHMRDSRRAFCPKDHWLIAGLDTESFWNTVVAEADAEDAPLDTAPLDSQPGGESRASRLLRQRKSPMASVVSPRLHLLNHLPFVLPFEHRVQLFRLFINNDRRRLGIREVGRPKMEVQIRRDHVFEDGFRQLYALGPALKDWIAISFIDAFGLPESGIDGGGVFKEFLTSLGHEAFNTDYGLFAATPEQLLYPHPSLYATEASQLANFTFLGMIIGKALYEGILLDVAFADFFLKKCLGYANYLDDLPSLDPDLYKGLIQVKNFKGNVEDLCLDFSLTDDDGVRTVNLIPHGNEIQVTNENRIRYVYLVANYRLNVQIAKQCKAFFNGLSTIIDPKWLRMFNQQETQILMGGASVDIDLEDLRRNTTYANYTDGDATIRYLWRALHEFSNEDRRKFVKFVTSCARPPVLGFKELQPPLCIRQAGADESRLPTSSTCVNLLKLPQYSSYALLKEKLLYSINAHAGFDLS